MNSLSELNIGGNGIVIHYNGENDIPSLTTREQIIADDKITKTINNHIANNSQILFMPIDVTESNYGSYTLKLFGVLMNGSKAEVNITDIDVFFDIGVPNNICPDMMHNHINIMLHDCNIDFWFGPNTIEAYSLYEFTDQKKKFIRIFTSTVFKRSQLINIIKKSSPDIELYSNDSSHYYRKAARELKLSLSDWVILTNYDYNTGLNSHSPLCEHIFKVNKENYISLLTNDQLRSNPLVIKDKTLITTWDIETYSTRKTGEVPSAEHNEDNAFMLCMTMHWLHEDSAFEKICIVDKETESDERWITIVCNSFINVIKAMAICWNHYKPDIYIGYNDSGYDWPFIMDKAIKLNILGWMWEKMSSVSYRYMNVDNIIKYHYNNNNKREIKINAEKDFYSKCPVIPGTVCIDALPCFMKLYPRLETNKYGSLKFYLQDNNLPTKVDLPIPTLWKYYESGDVKHMREIAYYCIVDSLSVQRLFVKRSIVSDYREISTLAYVSLSDSHYYAGGVKVCNLLGAYAWPNILVNMKPNYTAKVDKYPGAYVFPPDKGITPNIDRLKNLLESDDKELAIMEFARDRPVTCLDFASLYPSLIMTYNLSPEKIILHENDKDKWESLGYNLHNIQFDIKGKEIRAWSVLHNNDYDKMGLFPTILLSLFNKRKEMKKLMKVCSDKKELYELIFSISIDKNYKQGIIDVIDKFNNDIIELQKPVSFIPPGSSLEDEIDIHNNRIKNIKEQLNILKTFSSDTLDQDYSNVCFERNCIDKKQNALKIYMNTFYGETGNQLSPFFLLQLAGGVTSAGQYNIKKVAEYVRNKGFYIKYGDSVMPYTPITIKNKDTIFITTIDAIRGNWSPFPYFKYGESNRSEKEQLLLDNNLHIWTENGWSKIKCIIRHKTTKRIYRILTHTGLVDVTEDHSLLDENKNIIKPCECTLDTKLLHSRPNVINGDILKDIPSKYDIIQAYIYGMFVGDGSCGRYEYTYGIKYNWYIANKDYKLLKRCKSKLENIESGISFKIINTLKSSGVYRLIPYNGSIKDIVIKYRSKCYINKSKIVPTEILNSSSSKELQYFLKGLFDSDGCRKDYKNHGSLRIDTKNQITAQTYCLLFQLLDYNVSLNTRRDKPNIYRLTYTKQKQRKVSNQIKKIDILHESYTGYVYDIETETGSFHAGVGDIILKNTDSLYLTCPNNYFKECDSKYINYEYSKEEYFSAMVKITLRTMSIFEHEINEFLEKDNGTKFLKMENEGCNYPCLFLGKKKYFGIQHVNEVNFKPKKLYIKGIDVIKQGKSKIEKEIGHTIMRQAVSIDNDKNILDIVRAIIKESILENKWEFEDFIQTSAWKPTKQNASVQRFMKRMAARHLIELRENQARIESNLEPKELQYLPLEPGERFSYVLVKNDLLYDIKGRKINIKAGDIMEYANIAKRENMPIDVTYYLIHYVIGICARFISSDDQFMPPEDKIKGMDEKKIDEHSIKMAKKMLETYIKSLSGISKEEMMEHGKLCKRMFKDAVSLSIQKFPTNMKRILNGPLLKLAFDEDESDDEEINSRVIDILFSQANKYAEYLYNTYYHKKYCETLCTLYDINYKTGSNVSDPNKCTHLYSQINKCKKVNSISQIEFNFRKKIMESISDISEIIVQYKTNILYIIDKLKQSSSDDIYINIDYDRMKYFNEIWHTSVGIELYKYQYFKFKNYLDDLKCKRTKSDKPPNRSEIKEIIEKICNK